MVRITIKGLICFILIPFLFLGCNNKAKNDYANAKDSIEFVQKVNNFMKKNVLVYKEIPFGTAKNKLDLVGPYLRRREVEVGCVEYEPIFKYQRIIGMNIHLTSQSYDEFLRELDFIYEFLNTQYNISDKCPLNEDSLYERSRFNFIKMQTKDVDISGYCWIKKKAHLNSTIHIIARGLKYY